MQSQDQNPIVPEILLAQIYLFYVEHFLTGLQDFPPEADPPWAGTGLIKPVIEPSAIADLPTMLCIALQADYHVCLSRPQSCQSC